MAASSNRAPSCAYFANPSQTSIQTHIPFSLTPAGGRLSDPLYLVKPKNRGKTCGWYWDCQQPHVRIGGQDNATNRYAVYFLTQPDQQPLLAPPYLDLTSCHPALLHFDGTYARFHQHSLQTVIARVSHVEGTAPSLKLHVSPNLAKKNPFSMGKNADAKLLEEVQRLSELGTDVGIPPLQDGLLLCLVRISSLPLTDMVHTAGAASATVLMWRLGVTLPMTPPRTCTNTGSACDGIPFVQAISPCFAAKTDESRSVASCMLVSGALAPKAAGALPAQVTPKQDGTLELLMAGERKPCVFSTGGPPMERARAIVPTGTQPGAVQDAATGAPVLFSVRGLVASCYFPGLPDSAQAVACDSRIWTWPVGSVPGHGPSAVMDAAVLLFAGTASAGSAVAPASSLPAPATSAPFHAPSSAVGMEWSAGASLPPSSVPVSQWQQTPSARQLAFNSTANSISVPAPLIISKQLSRTSQPSNLVSFEQLDREHPTALHAAGPPPLPVASVAARCSK